MGTSRKVRGRLLVGLGVVGVAATAAALAAIPAQAQLGEVRSAGADAVPGSYIVVLKDGVTATGANTLADVKSKADSLLDGVDGTIGRTYSKALKGFSAQLGEQEAKELAANPSVAYVAENRKFTIKDTQENPPSWGLDRVDQRDLPVDNSYTFASTADTVTAFVIDTGVRATHEDFEGRATGGFDAIDNDDTPDDGHGHGTHVAGTIGGAAHGVAKGVKIVPVRVLDDSGSGTTEQVVAGIDWVAQNAQGPSVANMSLGGGVDETLDTAVRNAISAGVTFAVAAGNEASDASNGSPSRVEEAITVAASDDADNQADFSNFGSIVDIYGPGVDITSAWNTDDTATNTISGTSMATPHVAGAAALFLAANPEATPEEVAEALKTAGTPDKIQNPGEGTPNVLLFTGTE
jgi:subtilisin family serine protease